MKKTVLVIVGILLLLGGVAAAWYLFVHDGTVNITDFASCAAAGNPIMESYPEQCAANGQTYTNPDQVAPPAP